jgi:putative ATP-binding cassette transporter
MGERLVRMKRRLIKLNEFHTNRLTRETTSRIRRITNHSFEIDNLNIHIPYQQIILQSNIYLQASRNQSVFITGKTGCGKTCLMRICAGLWPLEAQYISLPARNNLIFIPQRPYLPIGSLRFQVECLFKGRSTVSLTDSSINSLFKLVNMDYILERYDLDKVIVFFITLSFRSK